MTQNTSDTLSEMLSQGEIECLLLVSQNRTSKQIAALLGISPHTVDNRIKRALSALRVGNRREAAQVVADSLASRTRNSARSGETMPREETNSWSDQTPALEEGGKAPVSIFASPSTAESIVGSETSEPDRKIRRSRTPPSPAGVEFTHQRSTESSPLRLGGSDGGASLPGEHHRGGGTRSRSFNESSTDFAGERQWPDHPGRVGAALQQPLRPETSTTAALLRNGSGHLSHSTKLAVILLSAIALVVAIGSGISALSGLTSLCSKANFCWAAQSKSQIGAADGHKLDTFKRPEGSQ